MRTNTFVSVEHCLSEITSYTFDRSFRRGFSKGWYKARIADAVERMNLLTHYQDMVVHVPLPADLRIELPEGMFNPQEIYVGAYDGNCCSPESLQWVHWKRTFDNTKGTSSKVSEQSPAPDPINPKKHELVGRPVSGNHYFANEQNGMLMFSDSCSGFTGVKLVAKGMGVVGTEIVIPKLFEEYVVDYVVEKFWWAKMGEGTANALSMYDRARDRLKNPVSGSQKRAQMNVVKSSGWIRENLDQYITNPHTK